MLINCVAYQQGQRLASIAVQDISDYIAKPDCFVWVALSDATPDEIVQMQSEFGLHALAVEDANKGHQRPKIEEYGDSLFSVIKTAALVKDSLTVSEVAIFTGHNYVLSLRSDTTPGFADVRERAEREPHLLKQGAAFVLYALMDTIVDRYFPVIDHFEQELEDIEENMFARNGQRKNIEQLYELKRKVTTMRHVSGPLTDALGKLYGGRVPQICLNTQDYFRDVHDHLCRIDGRLDSLRETITTAVQVNLSMVAIDESEVNKRLAAWAAIFAVVTAFAGVWGMNFKHMPELDWPYGYPIALSIMSISCVYLFFRFKKSGWL